MATENTENSQAVGSQLGIFHLTNADLLLRFDSQNIQSGDTIYRTCNRYMGGMA